MKQNLYKIIVALFVLVGSLQAMKHKKKGIIIYLINDTNNPLRITKDGKRVDSFLEKGEQYPLNTSETKVARVKYKDSYDATALTICLKDIKNKAQANNVRLHIVPAFLCGVTIGEFEPVAIPEEVEKAGQPSSLPGTALLEHLNT